MNLSINENVVFSLTHSAGALGGALSKPLALPPPQSAEAAPEATPSQEGTPDDTNIMKEQLQKVLIDHWNFK